jgi:hypothetical protein
MSIFTGIQGAVDGVNGGVGFLSQSIANKQAGNLSGQYAGDDGTGGSSAQDEANKNLLLAQLQGQEASAGQVLGTTDQRLNQGLTQLQDDYNKQASDANSARSQVLSRYATQREDTNTGKEAAINKVGDRARVLRDSVLQRIGQASGSGSSAYQLAAPGAINRDTQIERQDVVDTFGRNLRDLKSAEDDATGQYDRVFRDLNDKRNSATSALQEGVLTQKQQLQASLADIARQRAAVSGGGLGAINAAGAGYQGQVSATQNAINSLFDKYRTPYAGITPVNVQAPTLRDYTVDRGQVNVASATNAPASGVSPYAPFLKPSTDDNKVL